VSVFCVGAMGLSACKGGDSNDVDGSVGESWNENDPPIRDTEAAAGYCALAEERFADALPEFRDEIAHVASLEQMYFVSRLMDGMIAVEEVTGDPQIASDLLDIALAIVDAGEDRDGDGYLDYCTRDTDGTIPDDCSESVVGSQGDNPCCDDDPSKMPTDTWFSMRGPARVLRAAVAMGLDTTRPEDVEKLRDFLRSDVIDKWLDLDGDGPDEGRRGSSNSGILSQMTGILLDYYAATGEVLIGDLAQEWMLYIAADMQPSLDHSGAYIFDNDASNGTNYGYTDTNHSNYFVATLIEGFEAGYLTYGFIDPLQTNYVDLIWNQSEDEPLFAGYVDGSSDDSRPPWPDNVTFGWMRLGQFRRDAQELGVIIDYTIGNPWSFVQTNGNICRNFALALTEYPVPLPYQQGDADGGMGADGGNGLGDGD